MQCRLPHKTMMGGGGGGSSEPKTVSVTITGSGNSSYCYATINGTKRTSAGTYQVTAGSTITFGVYGIDTTSAGRVFYDGVSLARTYNSKTETQQWVVPYGANSIAIELDYTSSSDTRHGIIRVSTDQAVTVAIPVNIVITGTGNSTYCYVSINGTKYYNAGTYSANVGDTLIYGVYGYSSTYKGYVEYPAGNILSVTSRTTQTVERTVPDGFTTINMQMTYNSTTSQRNGQIVVTFT